MPCTHTHNMVQVHQTTRPPLLQVYLAINSVVDNGGSTDGITALAEGESTVTAAIPDAVRSSTKSFTAKLGLGRSSKPQSGTSTPERSASQRGDGAPNRCGGAEAALCWAVESCLAGLWQLVTLTRPVAAGAPLQSLCRCGNLCVGARRRLEEEDLLSCMGSGAQQHCSGGKKAEECSRSCTW